MPRRLDSGRKLPAAVALGRRGGKRTSAAKAEAARQNARRRPLSGAAERAALVRDHEYPYAVLGIAADGREVSRWLIQTPSDERMFVDFASGVLTYRVTLAAALDRAARGE